MTNTVSLTTIKEILENKGYSVLFGPPDKVMENQVSIEVSDLKLEIETPVIYHIHTEAALGIATSKPELLTAKVIKLVKDIEEQLYTDVTLGRGTFKFTSVTFSKPGELYVVTVRCDFFESILISI
jgi:hypothetical protein